VRTDKRTLCKTQRECHILAPWLLCRIHHDPSLLTPAMQTMLTGTRIITANLLMWTLTDTPTPTQKEGACGKADATYVGVVPHSSCCVRLY